MLLSGLNNPEIEKMRSALWGFFEILKANYEYIRFVLIEGVTRFTQISVFSSINNLYDITMDKEYASLFGYTEEEIKHYFSEYIEEGIKKTGLSYDEYMTKLRKNYGGYRFSPYSEVTVYNPMSIGLFFSKGGEKYDNYWGETDDMKLLMDVAKRIDFDISKDITTPISKTDLSVFDILNMASNTVSPYKYKSLLFQSGYLTIKGISKNNPNAYILNFPNEEVAESYSANILEMYAGVDATESLRTSFILEYFSEGKTEDAIEIIKSIYEAIPYDLSKHADELYYSSIFFSSMKALGAVIGSEIETKNGRVDAIFTTDKHIYVFEFKHDQSADIALKQIHDKGYANQFASDSSRTVHLVGINFSSSEKNINEWKEEVL